MKSPISTIVFIAFVLFISSCSKENSALEDFKKTSVAQEISQCVGANGSVDWKIVQPTDNKNTEVRVIEATLTKGANKFEMQWLYNLSTKVTELAYAGKQGEKTNQLMMGLQLGIFCMQKSSSTGGNNISPSPGTEKKTSESENIKSDDAVNNPQSAQSLDSCKKVGEARFNSAVAERCSGTWNIYASIPNGGVWYSDKMGNDPAAKQINNQAKKVEERLRGCGLVVHISLSNWFDSFTSNLVVVHSSPHPSAVEAAEELKRMKQCGIDGYSKKSEYRVVGRD